jgi:hypothetical protein
MACKKFYGWIETFWPEISCNTHFARKNGPISCWCKKLGVARNLGKKLKIARNFARNQPSFLAKRGNFLKICVQCIRYRHRLIRLHHQRHPSHHTVTTVIISHSSNQLLRSLEVVCITRHVKQSWNHCTFSEEWWHASLIVMPLSFPWHKHHGRRH